jgi:hypothetical protein
MNSNQIFVYNFKAKFAIDFTFNIFARLERTDTGISYEGRVRSRRDLLEIPSEGSEYPLGIPGIRLHEGLYSLGLGPLDRSFVFNSNSIFDTSNCAILHGFTL